MFKRNLLIQGRVLATVLALGTAAAAMPAPHRLDTPPANDSKGKDKPKDKAKAKAKPKAPSNKPAAPDEKPKN